MTEADILKLIAEGSLTRYVWLQLGAVLIAIAIPTAFTWFLWKAYKEVIAEVLLLSKTMAETSSKTASSLTELTRSLTDLKVALTTIKDIPEKVQNFTKDLDIKLTQIKEATDDAGRLLDIEKSLKEGQAKILESMRK